MAFFGIKNNSRHNDPKFIIHQSFTNILKKNHHNQVVSLKKINAFYNYASYFTKPLLYRHMDSLNGIIFNENLKDGSLITNRHPIKILSLNQSCSLKIYTVYKEFNGERKKLYILEAGNCNSTWSLESYRLGIGLEATLTEGVSSYTTYGYNKFSITKESGTPMDVHYSFQIDAFDENGEPAEIKTLKYQKDNNGNDKGLPGNFSFKTSVQCKLGGIKKVIVGFNEYPEKDEIMVKEYDISDICAGRIKTNVDMALAKMKLNLVYLMEIYEKQCDGKAVKIEKVPLSNDQDRLSIKFL